MGKTEKGSGCRKSLRWRKMMQRDTFQLAREEQYRGKETSDAGIYVVGRSGVVINVISCHRFSLSQPEPQRPKRPRGKERRYEAALWLRSRCFA